MTYLEVKSPIFDWFGQGWSEHWKIHITSEAAVRVDMEISWFWASIHVENRCS